MHLSLAGCGFLGVYHIGVGSCLREYASHLYYHKIAGASAGGLVACGLITGVCLGDCTSFTLNFVSQIRSHILGPLNPSIDITGHVRRGLDSILPPDAHIICTGRLFLSLTRVSDRKNVVISQYDSREELLDALSCTTFVPLWSGFIPPTYKGVMYVDGGLSNNLISAPDESPATTLYVSPFAGESDICPLPDGDGTYTEIRLANTSILLSPSNIYKMSRAFLPPHPEVLSNLCRQGFDDCLRFLHKNELLTCARCISIRSSYDESSIVPPPPLSADVEYVAGMEPPKPAPKLFPEHRNPFARKAPTAGRRTHGTVVIIENERYSKPRPRQSASTPAVVQTFQEKLTAYRKARFKPTNFASANIDDDEANDVLDRTTDDTVHSVPPPSFYLPNDEDESTNETSSPISILIERPCKALSPLHVETDENFLHSGTTPIFTSHNTALSSDHAHIHSSDQLYNSLSPEQFVFQPNVLSPPQRHLRLRRKLLSESSDVPGLQQRSETQPLMMHTSPNPTISRSESIPSSFSSSSSNAYPTSSESRDFVVVQARPSSSYPDGERSWKIPPLEARKRSSARHRDSVCVIDETREKVDKKRVKFDLGDEATCHLHDDDQCDCAAARRGSRTDDGDGDDPGDIQTPPELPDTITEVFETTVKALDGSGLASKLLTYRQRRYIAYLTAPLYLPFEFGCIIMRRFFSRLPRVHEDALWIYAQMCTMASLAWQHYSQGIQSSNEQSSRFAFRVSVRDLESLARSADRRPLKAAARRAVDSIGRSPLARGGRIGSFLKAVEDRIIGPGENPLLPTTVTDLPPTSQHSVDGRGTLLPPPKHPVVLHRIQSTRSALRYVDALRSQMALKSTTAEIPAGLFDTAPKQSPFRPRRNTIGLGQFARRTRNPEQRLLDVENGVEGPPQEASPENVAAEVSNSMDRVLGYFYRDENQQIKVTEIFARHTRSQQIAPLPGIVELPKRANALTIQQSTSAPTSRYGSLERLDVKDVVEPASLRRQLLPLSGRKTGISARLRASAETVRIQPEPPRPVTPPPALVPPMPEKQDDCDSGMSDLENSVSADDILDLVPVEI